MEKDVIMFFTKKKKKGHEAFPSWFLVNFVVKMIVFGQVLSVKLEIIKKVKFKKE